MLSISASRTTPTLRWRRWRWPPASMSCARSRWRWTRRRPRVWLPRGRQRARSLPSRSCTGSIRWCAKLRARIAAGDLGADPPGPRDVPAGLVVGGKSTPTGASTAVAGGPSRAFADIGSHWFDLASSSLRDRSFCSAPRFGTVFPRASQRGPRSRAVRDGEAARSAQSSSARCRRGARTRWSSRCSGTERDSARFDAGASGLGVAGSA